MQQRISLDFKRKIDDGRDPGYKRNGGGINGQVCSRHSIRYQRNVRPRMVAEHTAPFAREEMSKELFLFVADYLRG